MPMLRKAIEEHEGEHSMNEILEQQLIEIAPIFFEKIHGDPRETCSAFGCDCDDGWFDVIRDMVKEIEKINNDLNGSGKIVAIQIKEKFGELRTYVEIAGDVPDDVQRKVDLIIETAEERSWATCEHCGAPATKTTKGWISRLCDKCFDLRTKI